MFLDMSEEAGSWGKHDLGGSMTTIRQASSTGRESLATHRPLLKPRTGLQLLHTSARANQTSPAQASPSFDGNRSLNTAVLQAQARPNLVPRRIPSLLSRLRISGMVHR